MVNDKKVAVALSENDAQQVMNNELFRNATYIKRISINQNEYRIFFWSKEFGVDTDSVMSAITDKLYSYVEVSDNIIYSDVKIDSETETDGNFKKLISWVTRIFCPIDNDILG